MKYQASSRRAVRPLWWWWCVCQQPCATHRQARQHLLLVEWVELLPKGVRLLGLQQLDAVQQLVCCYVFEGDPVNLPQRARVCMPRCWCDSSRSGYVWMGQEHRALREHVY